VTGKLQQCVQDSLGCNSIPHSVANIVGNGCACSNGFTEQYDSSTGKLVACQVAENAARPQATVPSGMRTNITLPSSSSSITAVGNCSDGGRASVIKGGDGKIIIVLLSL
jgi:hypothetical protein